MENNETERGSGLALPPCSAVSESLALVDFGPCRLSARPAKWIEVAGPMCKHCEDGESVDHAAARILAAEYRRMKEALDAITNVRSSDFSDGAIERVCLLMLTIAKEALNPSEPNVEVTGDPLWAACGSGMFMV